MNLRNNSIQNHTNTVVGEELQESPKLGLEKLELDELNWVSGGVPEGDDEPEAAVEAKEAVGQIIQDLIESTYSGFRPFGIFVPSFDFPS